MMRMRMRRHRSGWAQRRRSTRCADSALPLSLTSCASPWARSALRPLSCGPAAAFASRRSGE
eukprot:879172-Pyramimonas_sp.AAC.1